MTQRGAFKKMKVDKIPENSRARRGVQILRELKRNPHRIFFAKPVIETDKLIIETTAGEKIELSVSDHPSLTRILKVILVWSRSSVRKLIQKMNKSKKLEATFVASSFFTLHASIFR